MENKSDTKGLLLVVFIVISVLLAGFVIYDKVLKKENCDCPKTDCQCEKCKECEKCNNACDVASDYLGGYGIAALTEEYKNVADKKSNIVFKADGTWSANRNSCHGYDNISGTYKMEENDIILSSDSLDSGKTVLTIVSGDSSDIYLLYEKELNITGCSNRRYFVIEK